MSCFRGHFGPLDEGLGQALHRVEVEPHVCPRGGPTFVTKTSLNTLRNCAVEVPRTKLAQTAKEMKR